MSLYTSEWRDAYRDTVRSSAAALVPRIVDEFHPATVIDVGCGEGWFLREFHDAAQVGVDGPWVEGCTHVDLTRPPYPDLGCFDLALCLEVAEHLPAECAIPLVDWLCDLAPVVVFSAATPGQGGVGHVNEQPPAFWQERFAARGYRASSALREAIDNDERISWWYRNNLTVFAP